MDTTLSSIVTLKYDRPQQPTPPADSPHTAVLREYALCKQPNDELLVRIFGEDIDLDLLKAGWELNDCSPLEDQVIFEHGRFEFTRHLSRHDKPSVALIFLCRDEHGLPIDLVAWDPLTGELATRHRRGAMLGAEYVLRRGASGEISVFSSPLDWLRTYGHGVVLIEVRNGAEKLRPAKLLIADNTALGRKLKRALNSRPVRVAAYV
jgi:hypothetical protein